MSVPCPQAASYLPESGGSRNCGNWNNRAIRRGDGNLDASRFGGYLQIFAAHSRVLWDFTVKTNNPGRVS